MPYSYVSFNIREYENSIFKLHIIIGSDTCFSIFLWSRKVISWRKGNFVGYHPNYSTNFVIFLMLTLIFMDIQIRLFVYLIILVQNNASILTWYQVL